MSKPSDPVPHFLRVVRALARVSGTAIPVTAIAAASLTACANTFTGEVMGIMATAGSGGQGGYGGHENGLVPGSTGQGGYGGQENGLTVAPTTGGTGGAGGYGGHENGLTVAPDAGVDAH